MVQDLQEEAQELEEASDAVAAAAGWVAGASVWAENAYAQIAVIGWPIRQAPLAIKSGARNAARRWQGNYKL